MSTSTANLGLSGAQTTQAIAAMDAFCNLLLSIHIDSSPAVPQVGAHLAGAQQTAQLWLKTTHQQTKNGLNLTASVANDFVGGIYPTLSTLAGKVPPEWGMWKNGLAQVGNRVSIAERCVQQGIEGVNQFRQAVTPICQGFASDAVAALSKVKGDEAEIARLQGDIERLQNKIDDDRKYENIGWILGPIGAVISHEVGDLIAGVDQMRDQINQDQHQLESDQLEVATLGNIAKQLGNVTVAADSLMAASVAMSSSLSVVSSTLIDIAAETDIPSGAFAMAQLQTVLDNFQDLVRSLPEFGHNVYADPDFSAGLRE